MDIADQTREQLVDELSKAYARIAELETSEQERMQAAEEAQRRAAQAALIYEVGQRLSGELELETLFSEIVTAICEAFDYYGVMLMLTDEEKRSLTLQAIAGGYVGAFPQDLQFAFGQGMIGRAAESGEIQISSDVTQNPHFVRAAKEETRSELSVPIKSGQKVIGVLDLQSDELDAFDEMDVVAMETLSAQIATAIENARLFEEAGMRAERLAIINRIAKAASSTLHPDDLMAIVYEEIVSIFHLDAFFVSLYDEKSNEMDFLFHVDEGIQHPREVRPLSGFSALVVTEKAPLIIRDLENEAQYHSMVSLMGTGKPSVSWLGAPLLIGEDVIGVINVQSYTPYAYDEEDEQLLFTIADQVAVALQNARLFQERGQLLQDMAVINTVGQAITSVLDLEAVLHQIVDVTKARFDQYFVGITLVEGDRLIFRSGSTVGNSEKRFQPGQLSMDLHDESGLIAEAVRTGEPVLTNDVLDDPRYLPLEDLPDTRSELSLPIKAKGRVIGVLDVQSDRAFAFDQADVSVLQSLANQAGVAIENARLFQETNARAAELAVLNELGQALTARLSVDEVLDEAYRQVARLIDTTNFYIALYDAEKDEVSFALDVQGEDIHKNHGTRKAGQGLTEYVICHRTPLFMPDNLPQRMEALGVKSIGQVALSWLGVPLMVGDQVLGVMTVQSYETPRLYDEHDRDLMTAIASQTAIAVQNAQLFEETGRRVSELQLLQDVSLAVASGIPLEEVLQITAEGLADEFGNVLVAFMFLDDETGMLRVAANEGYAADVVEGLHLPLGEGVVGWVAQRGEPVLLGNVLEDDRYREVTSDTRSELCVPLVANSKVIGALNIESPKQNAFNEDDQRLLSTLAGNLAILVERARLFENLEQMVADRTRELQESLQESERLQKEIIEAQKQAIRELSTPIIPIMDRIIVMPLVGSIDTLRARDITRSMLAGIGDHRAKVIILDITGVPVVDSGVANHLNKAIHAARLKGAQTIVTGISDAVAETIVDLGIDWAGIETLSNLQTGLIAALDRLGIRLNK